MRFSEWLLGGFRIEDKIYLNLGWIVEVINGKTFETIKKIQAGWFSKMMLVEEQFILGAGLNGTICIIDIHTDTLIAKQKLFRLDILDAVETGRPNEF